MFETPDRFPGMRPRLAWSLALLLLCAFAPRGRVAGGQVEPSPPIPGRLVDVGGHRVHLSCSGAGSTTVVFEAGAGAFSIDFALVQPEVAKFARACSYDRAGYAWSQPGPRPRTMRQIAYERLSDEQA